MQSRRLRSSVFVFVVCRRLQATSTHHKSKPPSAIALHLRRSRHYSLNWGLSRYEYGLLLGLKALRCFYRVSALWLRHSNPSLSAINAENQQIIKQTPNFTPKNVKMGVFILLKTNHIRSENNLIKNRTNEKNNQFIFRKISYLCSK